MVEELKEIWTNYDRQTVFNYVETRLHHYLFTKIFKDEAEIMSKIIEINERELNAFKINYFLNIPETQDLINNFDALKDITSKLDTNSTPYTEIVGLVKYMFESIKNDDTINLTNKNFEKDKLDAINKNILENKKLISEYLNDDIFSNVETQDKNVIYKRKDGNYGLIELA